jgi:hypothetical protein
MTRETSIQSWRELIDSGVLGPMKARVVQILGEGNPYGMTASELLVLGRSIFGKDSERDNYQKRLGELRDEGVVEELEPRKCSVTGRNVIVWRLTGNKPYEKEPKTLLIHKPSYNQALIDLRAYLCRGQMFPDTAVLRYPEIRRVCELLEKR